MSTPGERRALLFLAAVSALGLGVRGCRALRPVPPAAADRAALAAQIAAVDSAVTAGGRARAPRNAKAAAPATATDRTLTSAGRAPRRSETFAPVDVDVADAHELERLPGIGPALARRIVEDRAARGGFGSVAELQRVRGIGPTLAERLVPHVTFSAPIRPRPVPGTGRNSPHP